MNPPPLLARLIARGYTPVSHATDRDRRDTMTTPPPAPALPDAIRYVLLGTAALITYDGETGTAGLLQGGAEAACATHGLPASLVPAVYRHAALYLALASGYQPLDTADPVIDRALDELPGYPPERQARLLTYAARRAGTTTP